MAERISSLTGHIAPRRLGAADACGVTIQEIRGLRLHQIAAWDDRVKRVSALAAAAIGAPTAPGAGATTQTARGALLRIAPLIWWLRDAPPPILDAQQGTVLDISHAYAVLQIHGAQATALLNRHLPLDLRAAAFPRGAVASSALHHISVTLTHTDAGYALFVPRGFALSVWELLLRSVRQFGVQVAE